MPSCSSETGATVWYSLRTEATGRVKVSTFGSKFDTVLAVYRGQSLAGLLEAACNDDVTSVGSLQSEVTFVAEGGVGYVIQVGGWRGASGPLRLAASIDLRPVNDDRIDATPISLPFRATVDTSLATVEPSEPGSCGDSPNRTVWYRFNPSTDTAVSVSSTSDEITAFVEGPGGLQAVNCGGPYQPAKRTFLAAGGRIYWLQLSGWPDRPFDLAIDGAPPRANDSVAGARPITLSALEREITIDATSSIDEPSCFGHYEDSTVWFRFTSDADRSIVISTSGSDYDTVLGVFSADGQTALACNDDAGSAHQQSAAGLDVHAGESYLIGVGGGLAYRHASHPSYSAGALELRVLPGASAGLGGDAGAFVAADGSSTEVAAGGLAAGVGISRHSDTGETYVDGCADALLVGDCESVLRRDRS